MYWGRGVAEASSTGSIVTDDPVQLLLVLAVMMLPIVGGVITFLLSIRATRCN
jgi:hypothetical protein